MRPNPSYRYATIPVEPPNTKATAYIVRTHQKQEAIQKAAVHADANALIDIQRTRTFDTKREAKAYADEQGLDVDVYLPIGQDRNTNPDLSTLKRKLLK
jgi:hypothetical protein